MKKTVLTLITCVATIAFAKGVGPVPLENAIVHAFHNAVLYLCLIILAATACMCAFVGLRQVVIWLRGRLCPLAVAIFLLVAGIATSDAQKRGGNDMAQASLPRVGYVVNTTPRVAGEVTYLSFPGAVTNEKWRAHGAYEDRFYLVASNWWARMPDGGWIDRVRILSSGGFYAKGAIADTWTNYPPPFVQKFSLAPEAQWPLIGDVTGVMPVAPENGQYAQACSLFWHGVTPSNTLVMTWQGGLYARSHTNLVDFQAELFNDGSLDYRYVDHTERLEVSLPFDLDGDGLENSVDPEPETAGPDAHGTNAEWYNVVCSNVLEATVATNNNPSVRLAWRDGVNSNGYYFVDVVAERGPAPIYFMGDRSSALGNPVVVAHAGVTNRVPLLVGVDYAVTSDTPFSVSFPIDYMYPEVETNAPFCVHIHWPLNFVFTESMGASNRMYMVTVEPYDPGGVFSWEMRVCGSMLGGLRNGGCNCVSYSGRTIAYNCAESCANGGNCVAGGTYDHNGASFAVTGGVCRCGFNDPPSDTQPPPHDPSDGPSLTVTLSSPVVIFEDAYEDKPGEIEPRRSTRVRLTVDAYGGTHGGELSLSGENFGNLVAIGGGVILPHNQGLAAGATYHATGVYEGAMTSESASDVSVFGMFVETGTGHLISTTNVVSVVRVMLTPCATAPENPSEHRHLLGVGEVVNCLQCPSGMPVSWQSVSGWAVSNSMGVTTFTSPLLAGGNGMRATCGGQTYLPRIRVIEPEGIVAKNAAAVRYGVPKGEAGGIGMGLDLYVLPRYVSFSNIAMQETPCLTGTHSGYFNHPFFEGEWSHTTNRGAGVWYNIQGGNFFFRDDPRVQAALPRMMDDGTITTNKAYGWQDGTLVWDIPIGWGPRGTQDDSGQVGVINRYQQEFVIFKDGFVGVRKFSKQVTRRTNDVVYLDGVKK